MFGEKICMFTPKIKWLLEHGLIITKKNLLLNMEEMHVLNNWEKKLLMLEEQEMRINLWKL